MLQKEAAGGVQAITAPDSVARATAMQRSDLDKIKAATSHTTDASPFKVAVRNIIAACRSSPVSLASYCKEGVVQVLAASLTQVRRVDPAQRLCVVAAATLHAAPLLPPAPGPPSSCSLQRSIFILLAKKNLSALTPRACAWLAAPAPSRCPTPRGRTCVYLTPAWRNPCPEPPPHPL